MVRKRIESFFCLLLNKPDLVAENFYRDEDTIKSVEGTAPSKWKWRGRL